VESSSTGDRLGAGADLDDEGDLDRAWKLNQKEETMSLKEQFADQLKSQTDIWQAQIKDYQEQLQQAGAKAQSDYKKTVAQMEEKAEEARKLFQQVQSANEGAWKDMQTATQKAFAEIQEGWADALSRFQWP